MYQAQQTFPSYSQVGIHLLHIGNSPRGHAAGLKRVLRQGSLCFDWLTLTVPSCQGGLIAPVPSLVVAQLSLSLSLAISCLTLGYTKFAFMALNVCLYEIWLPLRCFFFPNHIRLSELAINFDSLQQEWPQGRQKVGQKDKFILLDLASNFIQMIFVSCGNLGAMVSELFLHWYMPFDQGSVWFGFHSQLPLWPQGIPYHARPGGRLQRRTLWAPHFLTQLASPQAPIIATAGLDSGLFWPCPLCGGQMG